MDPAAADHFGTLADPLTGTTYEIPKPTAPGETRLLRLVERHAKSSIPNRYFRQAMKNGILCPYCEVPSENSPVTP